LKSSALFIRAEGLIPPTLASGVLIQRVNALYSPHYAADEYGMRTVFVTAG